MCDSQTLNCTFAGTNSAPTRCIGENQKRKCSGKVMKKVSSSSILIGSLINQLCTILEKDPGQSKRLYFLLCDTLHQMKLIDPSYKLGGFELAQGKYMEAVYQLITVARDTLGSDNPVPIPRPLVTYVSSYEDQFRETGFIAGGGFGNVFKAVHKLDEVEYAIKKIVVRPGNVKSIMTHLEEVKTLAKLNHTNIVSYKQAWIEPMSTPNGLQCLPSISKAESNTYESRSSYSERNTFSGGKSYSYSSRKSKKSLTFSSDCQNRNLSKELRSKISCTSCESNSDIVSFREENEAYDISIESDASNNILEISSRSSTEESISSDESVEDRRICQYSSQTNQYAILYIQMALCEKTLRHWLDERTEPTPISMIASIATQILCGLNYIHSLKIVHHDIKPSNIFISTTGKLQVQLGDFGLACPLQRYNHDAIVGTHMYAAPEQLKGECNPKSDIYSLGIVLLELLIPMQTSMECIRIVNSLKAGENPTALAGSHPKWAQTISQLIQTNPIGRPSANELLDDLKLDKDLTITKLENENSKLQNENEVLRKDILVKDQIIEEQKNKIEELMAKLAKLES
ncbi:eukaryotic translation initiation factor 2-alpha kinase 1 isoform X2 [Nasonia vitripennis]|uniref:non-specific serine/threonine protein kinase n=1 Tax=Nasonia vitripennis TaxID=7425 RepID=A0A7M7IPT0_NASVI|nr:eukaryotic translation initiation factor 2-alpha kinase 1 isoform X2 [Nasonia vitripennis]